MTPGFASSPTRPRIDEHVAPMMPSHLLAAVSATCVLSVLVVYAVALPVRRRPVMAVPAERVEPTAAPR